MRKASTGNIVLEQVQVRLPDGFDDLLQSSLKAGVRNMSLLHQKWTAGEECFDQEGEALFAARIESRLVGIAGTTREMNYAKPAMRMRRLYVLPEFRRRGVARMLGQKCMETGLRAAPTLTCNARASKAAGPFWESLGFIPVDLPDITHVCSCAGT